MAVQRIRFILLKTIYDFEVDCCDKLYSGFNSHMYLCGDLVLYIQTSFNISFKYVYKNNKSTLMLFLHKLSLSHQFLLNFLIKFELVLSIKLLA